MGSGLLKAARYFPDVFEGFKATADFCLRINNVFDALNRTDPNSGLRPVCTDFKAFFKLLIKIIENYK